ncbi:endonuclease/exonuclease/phosphatase family protein [Actinoplanes sp. CA-015351]|uniref:endonuclease/exonuclease/phosphatase family protein n=1 Tax=Actinoplanes sp. CA-015351 TaxID=3239897 RepID=UPI003D979BBE
MPIIVAALLVFHRAVPNAGLLENFLPWLGLTIPFLLVRAWFRSLRALITALLPLIVWLGVFGDRVLPAPDLPYQLVAVQHNVSDENPDPAGTVRALLESRPDFIGIEEITPEVLPAYRAAFGAGYPHFSVQGTVALWSRHPLIEARLLDIRPDSLNAVSPGSGSPGSGSAGSDSPGSDLAGSGSPGSGSLGSEWNRGLRAVAETPFGEIAVYVVHLPSVRPDPVGWDPVRFNPVALDSARRDESARKLTAALDAEPLGRVLLLGDLNSTVDDRVLAPVLERLRTDTSGFAFSWPATMPLARIDHVMAGGMTVVEVRTLPRTGSDHLPVEARLRTQTR